jgi:hypothetical protein
MSNKNSVNSQPCISVHASTVREYTTLVIMIFTQTISGFSVCILVIMVFTLRYLTSDIFSYFPLRLRKKERGNMNSDSRLPCASLPPAIDYIAPSAKH